MSKQSTPINLASTVCLVRNKQTAKQILGTLLFYDDDGNLIGTLRSLELPNKGNSILASCLPAGYYMVKRILSKHYGLTFQVLGVPDRSSSLFHVGNSQWQTLGCILVGQDVCYVNADNDLDVLSSMAAMQSMVAWSDELFQLVITDVPSGTL